MRLLIVPLLALLAAGCDRQKAEQPQAEAPAAPPQEAGMVDTSHRGEAMPAIPFGAPRGGPATLTQFRGKPVMVNLWATWCAPCVSEMPTLDALAAKEADRFHLMVVSQDLTGAKAVAPFFAKHGFAKLQPYLDTKNVLMTAIRTETLPTTVFYDAAGKERFRVVGAMDWNGPQAQKLIADALAPAKLS